MRIAIAVLVLATSVAQAGHHRHGPVAEQQPEPVSRDLATALVFVGTASTIPLVIGATTASGDRTREVCGALALTAGLLGPSLGRWYARDPAWAGLATRALGMGLFVAAGRTGADEGPPVGVFVPGAIIVVAGAIYDFYMTPKSIDERNTYRAVSVVPTVTGLRGLAVVGSF